jgi:hypothetical protein
MQPGALLCDWMQGVLLSLLVVAVFLAVSVCFSSYPAALLWLSFTLRRIRHLS